MRRTLFPLLAAVLATVPLALPAEASTSYPFQRDTYGVDSQGLPALPESTVVATDGAGQVLVGGPDLVRLTTGGQLVNTLTPTSPITALAMDPLRKEAYVTRTGATDLLIISSDLTTGLADDDLTQTADGTAGLAPVAVAVDHGSPYWSQQIDGTTTGHPVVYAMGPDQTPSSTLTLVDVVDPTITSPQYPGEEIVATFPVRSATGITVAPDHSLYLTDASAGLLDHYTQQGVFVGAVHLTDPDGGPAAVGQVTIDAAGDVLATQGPKHRVLEYRLDGTYVGTFGDQMYGTDPQQPGGLYGPTSLTVDCEGVLWVLDTDPSAHKSRLVSFGGVGAAGPCAAGLPAVRSSGTTNGGFLVTTDRVGNVFVAGYGTVTKLDRTGHVLATWGNPRAAYTGSTTSASSFGVPTGIAALPNGDVLVVSSSFCTSWSAAGQCQATRSFSAGDSPPQARVVEFRSTGTWVSTRYNVGTRFWRFLGAVAVRSDGHIFLAENGSSGASGMVPHSVQEFTSAWAPVRELSVTPQSTTSVSSLSVRSLAFDAANDLLAGVYQDRAVGATTAVLYDYTSFTPLINSVVERWDKDGGSLPQWAGPQSAPADGTPPGGENIGDFSVNSVVPLRDGTEVWTAVQPSLYPHRATDAVLRVDASGGVLGALRPGLVGYDSNARATLDCAGDLVLLDGGVVRKVPVTTAVTCLWKPTAVTGALVSRTTTSLKVRCYSNPTAQVTRLRVLYGATATHGKATAWITLPSDNAQLTRDVLISGLLSKHTYHYAVQVTNASGTVTGADKVATTS